MTEEQCEMSERCVRGLDIRDRTFCVPTGIQKI